MTTLVLVHGGSVTSTAWDPILPLLRTNAVAVDLPGRRHRPADLGRVRLRDREQSVANDVLSLATTGVILVGHSSGGQVLPGAAALLPAGLLRHLVFVAATCPAEGDRPVDALAPKLRSLPLAHHGNLRARPQRKSLRSARGRASDREAPLQLLDPLSGKGVPDVPRTYVRALRDRVIPPDHAAHGGER